MKSLNINPESLAAAVTDAWVFWKDTHGKYLGCNDLMADALKLKSAKEIVGYSDYELPVLENEADFYRTADKMVIQKSVPMQFKDSATLPGKKHSFYVVKLPLISVRKTVGIVGVSYYEKNKISTPIKNETSEILKTNISLTVKEQHIATYLMRGKTAKEIANFINLSPRTVEHHIERIKIKCKVRTKSQLIESLFKLSQD